MYLHWEKSSDPQLLKSFCQNINLLLVSFVNHSMPGCAQLWRNTALQICIILGSASLIPCGYLPQRIWDGRKMAVNRSSVSTHAGRQGAKMWIILKIINYNSILPRWREKWSARLILRKCELAEIAYSFISLPSHKVLQTPDKARKGCREEQSITGICQDPAP